VKAVRRFQQSAEAILRTRHTPGEGRYVHDDPDALAANGQVLAANDQLHSRLHKLLAGALRG
jgi:hypothetical protein